MMVVEAAVTLIQWSIGVIERKRRGAQCEFHANRLRRVFGHTPFPSIPFTPPQQPLYVHVVQVGETIEGSFSVAPRRRDRTFFQAVNMFIPQHSGLAKTATY